MLEKSDIKGVYVGFILEFRHPYLHEVYYMSLDQYHQAKNKLNRASIPIDYARENFINLKESLQSNYWRNEEHKMIWEYIQNGEKKSEYSNMCDKLVSRSEASIKRRIKKIKKNNGYKEHQRYIHYSYDIDWLLDEIIRRDMEAKILNNVTDIQCE